MKKVNLNTPIPQGIRPDYHDTNMVLINNVHQIQVARERIMNEFFIVMLVQQGTCTSIVNGQEISLEKGDLLICAPGNILERGMVSIDFMCNIFLISPQFGTHITNGTQMSMSQYLMQKVIETLHLTPEEHLIVQTYYNLIASYNSVPNGSTKEEAVIKLMQAFAYTMAQFFTSHGLLQLSKKKYNSAQQIFRNFAQILKMHPEGRTVKYYSDRLNITPKYFNTICKQVSGKKASQLINQEIANLAKTMLADPDMTIKEVAISLGVVNQSQFGTFIRRELGASPQNIRKELYK
ncbi:MAG: helix-turn-helix domain-containing protein [Bacteroidaceae bacterium]|nr:helix-turn-helix domain-containing protein [Bacteroidaceae bacterium]